MLAKTWSCLLALFLLAGCGSTPAPANSQGDVPLQNTYWKLAVLRSVPINYYSGERQLHLVFQPDGRVVGFSGCNRLMGTYKQQGESLSFGPPASTRVVCEQGSDRERVFHDVLANTTRWRVMGTWLELNDANGAVLARFEAGR